MALGSNLRKQNEHKESADTAPTPLPVQQEDKLQKPRHSLGSEKNKLERINDQVRDASDRKDAKNQMMLIVFEVGREEFALPIEEVREVVKTPHIARIPQVPPHIRGVANVRGNVVAVVDLGIKMSLVPEERDPEHLMVIKSELYQVALGIDKVPNTLVVSAQEIDHSSAVVLPAINEEPFIRGIVRKDKRLIILLDILKMVSDEAFALSA